MTVPSLDNLPPELLNNIVNLIEDEDGWDEFPTDALLNMRETCRALERTCHNRFLLYFHEWVIDTEKDRDFSITKAVLASHVHAAIIEKITFTYKQCGLSLWQLAPLLHEVFVSLASLNRKLVLVFDPFADFKSHDDITTGEVMTYFNMILVMAAVSKLAIRSIHVRARREDWDKRHASSRESRTSLHEPHRTFPLIEYDSILHQIHQLLDIETHHQGTNVFPPLLVAKYPGIGYVSFDYLKGCLKMRNLHTFHWIEFRDWIEELECVQLDIRNCNLNPSELARVLREARSMYNPIQSLSIVDTVLYKKTAREDEPLSHRTSVYRLLEAIIPHAHYLKYVRFANIWGGNGSSTDSNPAFEKVLGGLQLRGGDGLRASLDRLRAEYFDEDTTSQDEDIPVQDEDTTSPDEDTITQDEGTNSQNEDTTTQDEDTIRQDEPGVENDIWGFNPFATL
jgi:hypothetical protein